MSFLFKTLALDYGTVSISFQTQSSGSLTTTDPVTIIHQPDNKALAEALQMSYTTYLKTERGHRELSFLMALRIRKFYKMDLHEFISMLSDEELGPNELSIIKALEKRERKKHNY